jgi:hypothetical protein
VTTLKDDSEEEDSPFKSTWSFEEQPSLEELVSRSWAGLLAGYANAGALYDHCVSTPESEVTKLKEWLIVNLPPEPLPDAERLALIVEACVAMSWASRALEAGDPERVQAEMARAKHYNDLASENFEARAPSARRRASGSKGGQKTGELHREKLVDLCVALLEARRPKTGWRTPRQAAQMISPELDELLVRDQTKTMRSAKNGPAGTRAEEWIVDRIKKLGRVRDAYLANCSSRQVTSRGGDRNGSAAP